MFDFKKIIKPDKNKIIKAVYTKTRVRLNLALSISTQSQHSMLSLHAMSVRLLFVIIVFTNRPSNAHFPDFCSYVTVTSGDDGARVSLLSLHGTLCYHVTLNSSTGDRIDRLYAVEYLLSEQVYPIQSSYNFSIPEIHTECACACPNVGQYMCALIERECAADNSTCVVVTELGQSPEGCVMVGGEAVSCCRITLTRSSRDNVTSAAEVIELAAPNETRYLFNVTVLDLNKAKLLRSDRVSLTLADNSELLLEDEYFELAIKRDSIPDELITPGLYIRNQGKVFKFWGDQINRVDERDLNKLGWYRNSPETDWRKILTDKVQIRTFNCGRNNGKAKIIGRYFNVEGSEGLDLDAHLVPLEDYHATRVETVMLESDKVLVRAPGSHQGPISVSLRSKRNTLVLNQVWLSDPAKLHSFTASVTRDQYGNNILDLTLEGAAGEIEGYIETSEGVKERLAVITPDKSYITRVGVLTVCVPGIRVCLNSICRVPSCRSHQMRGFSAPNSRLIRRDMSKINITYAGR